ncbi:hypothetical protein M0805_003285 [Coniferiporia weirii]|nr:hypothetical protein M0805_003285 [Coniferiporia weirii]
MLFSRVVSSLVFFLTIGAFALASAVDRRSTADIQAVFTKLKSSTDTILPEIKSAASSGSANDDTITPLVTQLMAALNTAQSSLTALDSGAPLAKRQSEGEVADLVASIVGEISSVLDIVLAIAATPSLRALLTGIDAALAGVLTSLGHLQTSIITIIGGLLASVSGIVESLGLGLTLGALGL